MPYTSGQERKRALSIDWKSLSPWAFGYVLLPIVLFALLWLRPAAGISVALATVAAGILALGPAFLDRMPWLGSRAGWRGVKLPTPFARISEGKDRSLQLGWKALLALVAVAVAWCFFGGQGSMWAQSADWTVRNAVFQDLIVRPWPVVYDGGTTALVYYVNHWLVPASIARVAFLVSGSASLALELGNLLLLAWTSAGVLLVELFVLVLLKASNIKAMVFAIALLVLFSGMDALGLLMRLLFAAPDPSLAVWDQSNWSFMHLEWWAGEGAYQFSSNTTLLFWVFNQTVIPWLCTCMLLLSRSLSSAALLVVACLAAGPYAGVGLAVIALVLAGASLLENAREGSLGAWIRNLWSPVNILAVVPAIVYAAYFLCNQSIGTSGERLDAFGALPGVDIATLALFLFLEAGAYAAIVGTAFWREPLFWAVGATLLAAPFIHIGSAYEFCCRATMPALFCLMLLCGAFLMKSASDHGSRSKGGRIAVWALVVCLAVGVVTPMVEFARGAFAVFDKGVEGAVQAPSDLAGAKVEEGKPNNFKAVVHQDVLYFKLFAG